MSVLKVEQVHKQFGEVHALNGVDLEVNEGQVYGFIGPNGAGKSTLIRVLLGIYRANQGKATVFGLDTWSDAVAIHKRIAYVPGDVNLWPNLTGGEVIDMLVKLRNHEASFERKKELVERFDLDLTKKCRTYSKGNRQKVALIAAFASDAEFLLLDEPTSGLDPLMEREFVACMEEKKKEGKTIFLSSHILSEVEKLCDAVSIIRKGEIVESGTISELRHLTRTMIAVSTENSIASIQEKPFVHDFIQKGKEATFLVDTSSMGEAISLLSQANIVSLSSAPPTLEELFMTHYQEG